MRRSLGFVLILGLFVGSNQLVAAELPKTIDNGNVVESTISTSQESQLTDNIAPAKHTREESGNSSKKESEVSAALAPETESGGFFMWAGILSGVPMPYNHYIGAAALDGTNPIQPLTGLHENIVEIGVDEEDGKVYWTTTIAGHGSDIHRANLDGSEVEDVIIGIPYLGLVGFTVDTQSNKMYWTRYGISIPGAIFSANLDGTNLQQIMTASELLVTDLAIDHKAGKIYWSETIAPTCSTYPGKIWRANLDGSEKEELYSTPKNIIAISLDEVSGDIYWNESCNNNNYSIKKADLDLQNIEVILSSIQVQGMDIDPLAGKIYWTHPSPLTTDKIWRANLDGSDAEIVLSGITVGPIDVVPAKGGGVAGRHNNDSMLGDLNTDESVDGIDLGILLSQWGSLGSADVNHDGFVNGVDLGILLGAWSL